MRLDWDCIRFTQTVGWEARDRPEERLAEYEDLVAWCRERDIVSASLADTLRARGAERPDQGRAALDDARTLRHSIYRILAAVAAGVPPDEARLEELNRYLHRFLPDRRLVRSGSGVTWGWRIDLDRLDHVLGPIAWSAAELLTAPEVERLRLCTADDCGWLFIDGSRNRSRRWCDMADCGNRAKVRRFRSRRGEGGR